MVQRASFKSSHRVWSLGLILLSLVITSGCAETFSTTFVHTKLSPDEYRRAVESFNDAIRWRDFNGGAAFVAPQQLDAYWQLADALNEYIRVADYQTQRIDFNQQARSGMVVLRYRYYHPQDPKMRTKDCHQKWAYDEGAKNWRVVQTGLQTLLEAD